MSKVKKSKTSKIEKLRKILDNTDDSEIKKFISKDDICLDSIRKRLFKKESSISQMVHKSSDSSSDKSDSLKPKFTIYRREPEIEQPEKKPYKTINRIEVVKKEQNKDDVSDNKDLIEIEKVEVSEPEFLRIIPKKTKKLSPILEHDVKETAKDAGEELSDWESIEEKDEKIDVEVSEPVEEKTAIDKSENNYCTQCGIKIRDGDFNFCIECGSKLTLEEEKQEFPEEKTKIKEAVKEEEKEELKPVEEIIEEQKLEEKSYESVEQIEDVEEDVSAGKDLDEVKKTDDSEVEFLKVIPEEKIKEYKKILNEIDELSPITEHDEKATVKNNDKDIPENEMVKEVKPEETGDKKEVEPAEIFTDSGGIYRHFEREVSSEDKIRLYHPMVVFEMWVFTIILGVVAVSGVFLIRDWLFESFEVYGEKFIPTPEIIIDLHLWFGFALVILGLVHIAVHLLSKKRKDILPRYTLRDFKAFLHSGMFLIGFARREDYGTSGRFNGRQRIVYVCLVYILGLTIITGFLYYFEFLTHATSMAHVIPAGLSIMVLFFHFLITIRKHDSIALKSAFLTGKVPIWYAKKNHPIWYEEFRPEREIISRKLSHPISIQTDKTLIGGGNNLFNAVSKFALLLEDSPDENGIKAVTEELQDTRNSDELQRIIELAEQLDEEIEIEVKQDTEEESFEKEDEIELGKEEAIKDTKSKLPEEPSEGVKKTEVDDEFKEEPKGELKPEEEKAEEKLSEESSKEEDKDK